MAMNIFHEIEFLEKHIDDPKEFEKCKLKLLEYTLNCPEEEKSKCESYLSRLDEYISYYTKLTNINNQHHRLENFVKSWKSSNAIKLEYIEPFGNSYGVYVIVDKFIMEMVYKPTDSDKKELRTKFYLDANGSYKQFVLKRGINKESFRNLNVFRKDYYVLNVNVLNWVDTIEDIITTVMHKTELFLQLCEVSCPYHKDGSHKYKSWKTKAQVEIVYNENTSVKQSLKNGEKPFGAHVVGGNGSFRVFDKGNYVLKITLDSLACERPVKYFYFEDIDTFMRQLKETNGWGRNMPYKK